jgi:hypothetical protein
MIEDPDGLVGIRHGRDVRESNIAPGSLSRHSTDLQRFTRGSAHMCRVHALVLSHALAAFSLGHGFA